MTAARRLVVCWMLCGTVFIAAALQGANAALAQSATQAAPTAKQVQVDLFRGLADIFSRGMDSLTDRLNRQGYSARVYSTHGWQSAATRIADRYTRGHRDIIVIVGHSLGGNAAFDIANALDKQNIPVELIVTFDATRPQPVPKNVLHFVNFYQENGFGKQVSAGPGFKGELTNVDLTADAGLSHTTIEKSPRLHAMVMKKIEDVVNNDLQKRIQVSRPKAKKAKKNS